MLLIGEPNGGHYVSVPYFLFLSGNVIALPEIKGLVRKFNTLSGIVHQLYMECLN